MKYLLFFLIPTLSFATTQGELVEIIQVRCDFNNKQIALDIREDCMLEYINCSVKLGGEIDTKDLDKCVARNRERK